MSFCLLSGILSFWMKKKCLYLYFCPTCLALIFLFYSQRSVATLLCTLDVGSSFETPICPLSLHPTPPQPSRLKNYSEYCWVDTCLAIGQLPEISIAINSLCASPLLCFTKASPPPHLDWSQLVSFLSLCFVTGTALINCTLFWHHQQRPRVQPCHHLRIDMRLGSIPVTM